MHGFLDRLHAGILLAFCVVISGVTECVGTTIKGEQPKAWRDTFS